MTSTNSRGATPDEWFHFDFVLGLGANLLPCVPAGDDVKVSKGSALEGKVGKIPSMFNRNTGEAHGIKDWQKRPIMGAEVQQWSADPRLNICVRLGPLSGVYAFDVDIEERAKAEEIVRAIEAVTGPLPKRWRENSGKCLLMFKMEGA